MSPSGIYIQTDPDKQSLKMQKQDDIARQIDYNNNIIIMIGAGLTICVLASFQLYINK
jgi:copper homeostasis protein CutC